MNKRTAFAAGVLFMLSLTYMAIFVAAWNPLDEEKAIQFVQPDGTKEIQFVQPDGTKAIQFVQPEQGVGLHYGDGSVGSYDEVYGGLTLPCLDTHD